MAVRSYDPKKAILSINGIRAGMGPGGLVGFIFEGPDTVIEDDPMVSDPDAFKRTTTFTGKRIVMPPVKNRKP